MKTKRKLGVILAILFSGIVFVGIIILAPERNPAFAYSKTTWNGHSAFGKLNRDGTYSFYSVSRLGSLKLPGNHIATFPNGEAAKLH